MHDSVARLLNDAGARDLGFAGADWGEENGAGEILLTSWDRNGSRRGYDLALIRTISAAAPIPLIASGGAEHMADAFKAGADA